MLDFLPDSPMFLLYLGVLLGPFVQEDAAAVTAATLSVTGMADTKTLIALITLGLFLSDIWKYWIGWAALRNKRGQSFAEKEHIADMKDKVHSYTFTTLIAARFIPLTRIPAYVACGFFGVSYIKFCFYIFITASMYVAALFTMFHVLGEVLGEKLMWVMPIIALSAVIIFAGYFILKKRKQTQD